MGLPTINRKHLFPKAHYFLYFGGMASFWPSITVFAKQLGVSEVAVGLLFTAAPVTGLISMPMFGAIADRYKIKKKLFLVFNIINLLALMSFALLPQAEPLRPASIECALGVSYITQSNLMQSHNDKCNKTDIEALRKYKLIETCDLECKIRSEEGSSLCSVLMDESVPSYCSDGRLTAEDNFTLRTRMEVRLKVHEAVVLDNVLYLPIDRVSDPGGQNPVVYSCMSKSIIEDCQIDCFDNHVLNFRLQKFYENEDVYSSGVFWAYVCLVLVNWIAFAVVTSVADALCFQTLENKPHLYGIQRQWGAMGWGLFSLFSGYLIDKSSQGSLIKDYSPCFYLVFVTLILNFIVCYKWEILEEQKPRSLGKTMVELLIEPKISIFILACITVGVCTGLLWNFLFWYAEDIASCEDMEWIKVLQGLISIVQCFGGELPFFYLSSWFIKKLGHVHCMTLVLGAFGVRFLLYSVISNPWAILPVELLQGVTYGIFYSNMASYAYVVSPPGSAATVQGIVGAAFEGIGVGVGSLLGGILYEKLSGRLAFRIFGMCTLVFCAVHYMTMSIISRKFTPVSQTDSLVCETPVTENKDSEMQNMMGKNQLYET